jgi:hypothetical protein
VYYYISVPLVCSIPTQLFLVFFLVLLCWPFIKQFSTEMFIEVVMNLLTVVAILYEFLSVDL